MRRLMALMPVSRKNFLGKFIGAVSLIVISQAAAAQSNNSINDSLTTAAKYLQAGEYQEACDLLDSIEGQDENPQVKFLLGQCNFALHDFPAAVFQYELMLDRNTNLPRVRAELGRTLAAMGRRKDAKETYLELLKRDDLPPNVRQNLEQQVQQIETMKRWGGVISVGYLMDSNVNSAPSDPNIQSFGLPFVLDSRSVERKGQAFQGSASLNYNFDAPLADEWASSIFGNVLEYAGEAAYDTKTIGVSVGPNFYRWAQYSFPVGLQRKWTNRKQSSSSWSFNPSISKQVSQNAVVNFGATWNDATDLTVNGTSSGISRGTTGNVKYQLGQLGQIEMGLSYTDNKAAMDLYNRSITRGVSAGFYTTIPIVDVNLALQPSFSRIKYKKADPVDNGRYRADNSYVMNLNFSKDVVVLDEKFTPVVGVTFTNNASNIDRRDYRKAQLTFQIRKQF